MAVVSPNRALREQHNDPAATRPPRRLSIVALLLLLIGTAASIVGGLTWDSYLRNEATRTFDSQSSTAANALSIALQRDVDLAATARTLIETTPSLTNAQFATWFKLLGTHESYPGSFGVLYVESVSRQGLSAFAAHAVNDPPLGLAMQGPFAVAPANSRPPYCFTRAGVVQVSSSLGIPITSLADLLAFTAPDLNYCALPIGGLLRQSAASGRDAAVTLSSLISASPRHTPLPDVPGLLLGFLDKSGLVATISPVYTGGSSPAAEAARAASLKGWILGIYQANSILATVLQGRRGAAATLYYTNPSGQRTMLASVGTPIPSDLAATYPLAATGNWSVMLEGPPPFSGLPATGQGIVIVVVGFLLSLLLFLLIRVLSRSRAKALELVEARTAQLRDQAVDLRSVSSELGEKVRELEAAEEALTESEALFRSLAESSPIGVFSLGRDGEVLYSNGRLLEIGGREPGSVPAEWTESLHEEDRERFGAECRLAVERRLAFRQRVRLVRPGGEVRFVDVTATPVLGGEGPLSHVGTAEDVTEILEAQRQQSELEARLRSAERLESLGQLSGGIAHDFNNLLFAMDRYAQFVAAEIDELSAAAGPQVLERMRSDVAAIRKASEQATDLTRQLLIFGRKEIIHPEVLDANELVHGAVRLLSRTIGEHINLDARLAPGLWPVCVDRSRFEQVVLNLVVNARDAIVETGTVSISTENQELDEDEADALGIAGPGRYVLMTVRDDGAGMAPETLARAFEPFFTTKPKGQGTGLGLATVYGVVNQLGGLVTLSSEPGAGTVVRVYLPASEEPVRARPEADRVAARGRGETVLLVDDDDNVREVTARILTENGYAVVTAADGERALAELERAGSFISVLLTDVVMPRMSGIELAERVRALRPDLPVVFMSGYAEGLVGPQASVPVGVELLEKPFDDASLLQAVDRLLGSRAGI